MTGEHTDLIPMSALTGNEIFGLVWLSNSSLWQVGGLRERLEKILLGDLIEPLKLKKPIKLNEKSSNVILESTGSVPT